MFLSFVTCISGSECAELVTDTTYSTSSGVQPLSVQNTVIVFSFTSLQPFNNAYKPLWLLTNLSLGTLGTAYKPVIGCFGYLGQGVGNFSVFLGYTWATGNWKR